MTTLTGVVDRLRHTDEETAAGRQGIQAVRAQLGQLGAVPYPRTARPVARESVARETVELPHLELEMAWGAERDRLEARVRELEGEVTQLRRALGTVLREAASAVSPRSGADRDR